MTDAAVVWPHPSGQQSAHFPSRAALIVYNHLLHFGREAATNGGETAGFVAALSPNFRPV